MWRYWMGMWLLVGIIGSTNAAPPAEVDWLDLMPLEDQQALEAMPEIDHFGREDQGFSEQSSLLQAEGLPEVMYSTRTVPQMDGKTIRLGGYPVPLETNAKGDYVEFFLVPYPGACIHVPPPPPNQIVLVQYPKGIRLDDIYAPLWVDGPLQVLLNQNDLASSAYQINAQSVTLVDEDDF